MLDYNSILLPYYVLQKFHRESRRSNPIIILSSMWAEPGLLLVVAEATTEKSYRHTEIRESPGVESERNVWICIDVMTVLSDLSYGLLVFLVPKNVIIYSYDNQLLFDLHWFNCREGGTGVPY